MKTREYTPSLKQEDALKILSNNSNIKVLGYGGAKGGGKSSLARTWLMLRCELFPGSYNLILRKSYSDVYRNHVLKFLEEYPQLKFNQQTNIIQCPNGSKIEVGNFEDSRSLDKYQGVEYHSVVIDQAEQLPKLLINTLRSCMRSVVPGLRPKMLITFNWGNIGHKWLKKMFVDRVPDDNEDLEDTAFLRARVYDNTFLLTNDKDYVKSLEALPSQLKRAFLEGDENAFVGSFFTINPMSALPSYELKESKCWDRLYGSLDHGITHPTSFGLWYLDDNGDMIRLFSYLNNGGNAQAHAAEIRDRCEAFKWSHGILPVTIFADPSMWTKHRLNDIMTRSVIDEYEAVFAGSRTKFEKANNDKRGGCDIMRNMFSLHNGIPRFKFFKDHNTTMVENLHAMTADENNPEIYIKADGDDVADECRYGIMGLYSIYQSKKISTDMRSKLEIYNRKRMAWDWRTG